MPFSCYRFRAFYRFRRDRAEKRSGMLKFRLYDMPFWSYRLSFGQAKRIDFYHKGTKSTKEYFLCVLCAFVVKIC